MEPARRAALLLVLPIALAACSSQGVQELSSVPAAEPLRELPNPEYLTLVTWNVGGGRCADVGAGVDALVAEADTGPGARRALDVLALQEAPLDLGRRLREEGLGRAFWGSTADGGLLTASRVRTISIGNAAGAGALVAEYPLPNGRTLLVANVRPRASRWPGHWEREVDQVLDQLAGHPGPVVLCGDLGTDDEDRRLYLDDATYAALGMKRARPAGAGAPTADASLWRGTEPGISRVHVYFRGMFLEHCEWRTDVPGADQAPLVATFRFAPQPDGDGS